MTHFISLVFIAAVFSTPGHSDDRGNSIRNKLRKFENNTAEFMKQIPEKTYSDSRLPTTPPINANTSKYELINAEINRLEGKSSFAESAIFMISPPAVPIEQGDRAEDLVDELKYRSLEKMESAGLLSAQLKQHPWSDSYWPIARGTIAWRYADSSYPGGLDWKANADYLLDSRNSCSVDQLSPAEKYDLLVGDSGQSLTNAMLKEGRSYFTTYGKVESWMGICHGWAPASYMAPRPEKTIAVMANDGKTEIHFRPSDLKALTSLLWANGSFENRFIGQRCYNKKPDTDENGRITEAACYGENPGTWHLSVVNQIGVSKRSFVMDALHDTEIWNQPIYGYTYTYFNPQTKEPTSSLSLATIPISAFTSDKFKKYRSPKTRAVVGIAMDLTYVAETTPSVFPTDSPENDLLVTVHYLYDLELGSGHKIVGGEWYSNAHPGFLWGPVQDAHAISNGDRLLANRRVEDGWSGSSPLPAEWSEAILYSSRRGQPLARIIETLGVLTNL